jgi:hypothetical protein
MSMKLCIVSYMRHVKTRYEYSTIPRIASLTNYKVTEAILSGQASLLENLSIPKSVLGSLELDIALSELDQLLVKLPRLVLLVRAARQDPTTRMHLQSPLH